MMLRHTTSRGLVFGSKFFIFGGERGYGLAKRQGIQHHAVCMVHEECLGGVGKHQVMSHRGNGAYIFNTVRIVWCMSHVKLGLASSS